MINKIYGNIKPFNTIEKHQNSSDENFSNTLNKFLHEVNDLQLENAQTTEDFLNGDITDLHQVTIAAQKARVSMELLLQIRNKLIETYQEIMRMQV